MLSEKVVSHFNVVADFSNWTHEQWQEQRKNHYGLGTYTIGGSDAGVLMRVNKYKDVPTLYLEKKNVAHIEVSNEAVEWGNILEPIVANKFKEKNQHLMVDEFHYLIQHRTIPYLVANIDRLIYDPELDEYGILEIKTASEYLRKEWANGNIPPSYYAQIQHYFAVTGLEWGYFAVLIGGNTFHQVEVQRNQAYIDSYLFQAEHFMERLDNDIPPELTGSDSSTEIVNTMYPQGTVEEILYLEGLDIEELLEKRDNLKFQIDHLKEQEAECTNKLKILIGDYKKAEYNRGLISYRVAWGNVKGRTTVDSKKLQADYPDVYKEVVKTGNPSRKFTVENLGGM